MNLMDILALFLFVCGVQNLYNATPKLFQVKKLIREAKVKNIELSKMIKLTNVYKEMLLDLLVVIFMVIYIIN